MITAIIETAPVDSHVTSSYVGDRKLLVLYGSGEPGRQAVLRRHLSRGGVAHCWDLAYWNRKDHLRVAVNGQHPTHEQLDRTMPDFARAPSLLDEKHYDQHGPILLVGLGRKTREQLGLRGPEWELRKIAELREKYPGRKIVYRPKGKISEHLNLPVSRSPDIFEALRGVSLVVCKHSNVALDACRAGVPVSCEAGVAHWLYHREPNPGRQERLTLLAKAARWQYGPEEAETAWKFLSQFH